MPKWSDKDKKRDNKNEPLFEKSSGNVFIDLGFPEHEAINIVARLELMFQIENIIHDRGWTQQEAAKVLGIRQPRVCELVAGRSEKFTVDMLMKLLDRLGKEVKLTVKDKEVA